jgi:hypothetical protein
MRRSILFSKLFEGDQKAGICLNKATGAPATGSHGNHVDAVETGRNRAKQQRHVSGLGFALWAGLWLIGLAIVSLALGISIDPNISIFASP